MLVDPIPTGWSLCPFSAQGYARVLRLAADAPRRADVDRIAGLELRSMVMAFTQYGAPEKR
jgi:hypothetical protein